MATKETEKSKKPGLYANIQAKKERIEKGSGEAMRKKGAEGTPEADAVRKVVHPLAFRLATHGRNVPQRNAQRPPTAW